MRKAPVERKTKETGIGHSLDRVGAGDMGGFTLVPVNGPRLKGSVPSTSLSKTP